MASPQSFTALLEQTGWVQSLARRLVQDPSLADDLAQDTLVRALEERPDAQRSLRGWLATVMRNNLLQRHRGEGRRSARERARSRTEAEPSALDVVERAATHGDVVQAVLALEEPYRSTILMRFFDQLSYDEIARRLGITRATVNSRVTRGLERLRQRLAADYGGDRHALFLALAPLARSSAGALAVPLAGVKLMNLVLGATTLTLAAVTLSVGLKTPTERERRVEPGITSTRSVAEPSVPVKPTSGERVALPAMEPVEAQPAAELDSLAQEKRQAERWETTLFQSQVLAPTIETLLVNTGSGDVRIEPSPSGNLEISARVQARIDEVDRARMTQLFEDHVTLATKGSALKIETAHKNESGWSVSFTVGLPRSLAVTANTGSGDVEVAYANSDVTANTGSGDVQVRLADQRLQRLRANTGSGDVEVEVLAVEQNLSANTGSGDVEVRVHDALSPGKVSLNSGSGDGTLAIPAGIVGSFTLESHGGEISTPPALGLSVQKKGGMQRVTGTLGSGGGKYDLNTGSGDLEIRFL